MSEAQSPSRTVINWKEEEALVVERAARSSGLSVAAFARAAALRTARQVLSEAPSLDALYAWITEGTQPPSAPATPPHDDDQEVER